MATITGLQSPNPYAQGTFKARTPTHVAASAENALNHAASASASYSPDWMQADSASAPQAAVPEIYGAKGEPLRLSPSNPLANGNS